MDLDDWGLTNNSLIFFCTEMLLDIVPSTDISFPYRDTEKETIVYHYLTQANKQFNENVLYSTELRYSKYTLYEI